MAFQTATVESASPLHPELPDPAEASKLHPDGALYVTDTEPAGQRFRLRHAQPARWQRVREPKDGAKSDAQPAAAPEQRRR
jgi:hypothetical protein